MGVLLLGSRFFLTTTSVLLRASERGVSALLSSLPRLSFIFKLLLRFFFFLVSFPLSLLLLWLCLLCEGGFVMFSEVEVVVSSFSRGVTIDVREELNLFLRLPMREFFALPSFLRFSSFTHKGSSHASVSSSVREVVVSSSTSECSVSYRLRMRVFSFFNVL